MEIHVVMDEVANAIRTVVPRSYSYPIDRIEPPAAIVGWPTDINYDTSYRGGSDEFELPVLVALTLASTPRANRLAISDILSGAIRDAVDNGSYTGDPLVKCLRAEVDVVGIGNNDYLSALFTVSVCGDGTYQGA